MPITWKLNSRESLYVCCVAPHAMQPVHSNLSICIHFVAIGEVLLSKLHGPFCACPELGCKSLVATSHNSAFVQCTSKRCCTAYHAQGDSGGRLHSVRPSSLLRKIVGYPLDFESTCLHSIKFAVLRRLTPACARCPFLSSMSSPYPLA